VGESFSLLWFLSLTEFVLGYSLRWSFHLKDQTFQAFPYSSTPYSVQDINFEILFRFLEAWVMDVISNIRAVLLYVICGFEIDVFLLQGLSEPLNLCVFDSSPPCFPRFHGSPKASPFTQWCASALVEVGNFMDFIVFEPFFLQPVSNFN
jgi:hypothetical protein